MRTILLIAYYYPPLGGIGSLRALSFARHLPSFGYRPVVVTPEQGAYGKDASLDAGAGRELTVVRTGSFEPAVLLRRLRGPRTTGDGAAAGDFVEPVSRGGWSRAVRRLLHGYVYFPDHANGWIPAATRAAVRAGREHHAVAVLSSSPPVSAHVVGLRAARRLGVPAVLDVRDLWTAHREDTARGPRHDAERRLERRMLRRAAAVTTVSEACRAWLVARHGALDDPERFVVLRNGYEEALFDGPAPPPDPGVFRIVHTGTVYGAKQDLSAFFRALSGLRTAGAFGPLRPEVVFAGKVETQSVDAARAAGVLDLVQLLGFVPHHEAVRLLRSATVNLLLTWSVPGWVAKGVCPGKMYEQIAAGRPVLALALPDCEAAEVTREAGGTLVADPHDEPGIRDALARLVAAARAGDAATAAPPRVADPTPWSRRVAAARLAATLDRVL